MKSNERRFWKSIGISLLLFSFGLTVFSGCVPSAGQLKLKSSILTSLSNPESPWVAREGFACLDLDGGTQVIKIDNTGTVFLICNGTETELMRDPSLKTTILGRMGGSRLPTFLSSDVEQTRLYLADRILIVSNNLAGFQIESPVQK